jgi:cytochrome P450
LEGIGITHADGIPDGPGGQQVHLLQQLRARTPRSFRRIFGDKSIVDMHGEDHRRIRGALMEFLKPDMLKLYVGRVDGQVRRHLRENWRGRTTVRVLPLMKRLTFDVVSELLLGLETGAVRDALVEDFRRMVEGVFAVPVDLPFTTFRRSLVASRRARLLLEGITRDKKAMLGLGKASPSSDLITRLLSLTDGHGEQLLTDEEIVDNGMFALVAGHDTTSMLMASMVRHLASDPATLAAMVQGKCSGR